MITSISQSRLVVGEDTTSLSRSIVDDITFSPAPSSGDAPRCNINTIITLRRLLHLPPVPILSDYTLADGSIASRADLVTTIAASASASASATSAATKSRTRSTRTTRSDTNANPHPPASVRRQRSFASGKENGSKCGIVPGPGSDPFGLDKKGMLALATEVVNVGLRSLTAAAATAAAAGSAHAKASTGSGSKPISKAGSAKSAKNAPPSSTTATARPDDSGDLWTGTRCLAECVRAGFEYLEEYIPAPDNGPDVPATPGRKPQLLPALQWESGQLNFLTKLVACEIDDLALREMDRLKPRLDILLGGNGPGTAARSSGSQTGARAKGREGGNAPLAFSSTGLSSLLVLVPAGEVTPQLKPVLVSYLLAVLRLFSRHPSSFNSDPKRTGSVVDLLSLTNPLSAASLLLSTITDLSASASTTSSTSTPGPSTRSANKSDDTREKAIRQLEGVAHLLLSACPSISVTEDEMHSDARLLRLMAKSQPTTTAPAAAPTSRGRTRTAGAGSASATNCKNKVAETPAMAPVGMTPDTAFMVQSLSFEIRLVVASLRHPHGLSDPTSTASTSTTAAFKSPIESFSKSLSTYIRRTVPSVESRYSRAETALSSLLARVPAAVIPSVGDKLAGIYLSLSSLASSSSSSSTPKGGEKGDKMAIEWARRAKEIASSGGGAREPDPTPRTGRVVKHGASTLSEREGGFDTLGSGVGSLAPTPARARDRTRAATSDARALESQARLAALIFSRAAASGGGGGGGRGRGGGSGDAVFTPENAAEIDATVDALGGELSLRSSELDLLLGEVVGLRKAASKAVFRRAENVGSDTTPPSSPSPQLSSSGPTRAETKSGAPAKSRLVLLETAIRCTIGCTRFYKRYMSFQISKASSGSASSATAPTNPTDRRPLEGSVIAKGFLDTSFLVCREAISERALAWPEIHSFLSDCRWIVRNVVASEDEKGNACSLGSGLYWMFAHQAGPSTTTSSAPPSSDPNSREAKEVAREKLMALHHAVDFLADCPVETQVRSAYGPKILTLARRWRDLGNQKEARRTAAAAIEWLVLSRGVGDLLGQMAGVVSLGRIVAPGCGSMPGNGVGELRSAIKLWLNSDNALSGSGSGARTDRWLRFEDVEDVSARGALLEIQLALLLELAEREQKPGPVRADVLETISDVSTNLLELYSGVCPVRLWRVAATVLKADSDFPAMLPASPLDRLQRGGDILASAIEVARKVLGRRPPSSRSGDPYHQIDLGKDSGLSASVECCLADFVCAAAFSPPRSSGPSSGAAEAGVDTALVRCALSLWSRMVSRLDCPAVAEEVSAHTPVLLGALNGVYQFSRAMRMDGLAEHSTSIAFSVASVGVGRSGAHAHSGETVDGAPSSPSPFSQTDMILWGVLKARAETVNNNVEAATRTLASIEPTVRNQRESSSAGREDDAENRLLFYLASVEKCRSAGDVPGCVSLLRAIGLLGSPDLRDSKDSAPCTIPHNPDADPFLRDDGVTELVRRNGQDGSSGSRIRYARVLGEFCRQLGATLGAGAAVAVAGLDATDALNGALEYARRAVLVEQRAWTSLETKAKSSASSSASIVSGPDSSAVSNTAFSVGMSSGGSGGGGDATAVQAGPAFWPLVTPLVESLLLHADLLVRCGIFSDAVYWIDQALHIATSARSKRWQVDVLVRKAEVLLQAGRVGTGPDGAAGCVRMAGIALAEIEKTGTGEGEGGCDGGCDDGDGAGDGATWRDARMLETEARFWVLRALIERDEGCFSEADRVARELTQRETAMAMAATPAAVPVPGFADRDQLVADVEVARRAEDVLADRIGGLAISEKPKAAEKAAPVKRTRSLRGAGKATAAAGRTGQRTRRAAAAGGVPSPDIGNVPAAAAAKAEPGRAALSRANRLAVFVHHRRVLFHIDPPAIVPGSCSKTKGNSADFAPDWCADADAAQAALDAAGSVFPPGFLPDEDGAEADGVGREPGVADDVVLSHRLLTVRVGLIGALKMMNEDMRFGVLAESGLSMPAFRPIDSASGGGGGGGGGGDDDDGDVNMDSDRESEDDEAEVLPPSRRRAAASSSRDARASASQAKTKAKPSKLPPKKGSQPVDDGAGKAKRGAPSGAGAKQVRSHDKLPKPDAEFMTHLKAVRAIAVGIKRQVLSGPEIGIGSGLGLGLGLADLESVCAAVAQATVLLSAVGALDGSHEGVSPLGAGGSITGPGGEAGGEDVLMAATSLGLLGIVAAAREDAVTRAERTLARVGREGVLKWPVGKEFVTKAGQIVREEAAVAVKKAPTRPGRKAKDESATAASRKKGTVRAAVVSPGEAELHFQQDFINRTPADWAVRTLSLSPDGSDLFVARLDRGREPFILRLPLGKAAESDGSSVLGSGAEGGGSDDEPEPEPEPEEPPFNFAAGKAELDEIVDLSNFSAHNVPTPGVKGARTRWWREREALDRRLGAVMRNVQRVWLGGFRGVLAPGRGHRRSGDGDGDDDDDDSGSRFAAEMVALIDRYVPSARGHRAIDDRIWDLFLNLRDEDAECGDGAEAPARADHHDSIADPDDDVTDLLYLLVDTLSFGSSSAGPVAYDEIDFDRWARDARAAISAYRSRGGGGGGAEDDDGTTMTTSHTVLVLEKRLHQIPWECMPCLRRVPVTRLPSMAALAHRVPLSVSIPSSSDPDGSGHRDCAAGGGGNNARPKSRTTVRARSRRNSQQPEGAGTTVTGIVADRSTGAYLLNPGGDLPATETALLPYVNQLPSAGWIRPGPDEKQIVAALHRDVFLFFGHGSGAQYVRPRAVRGVAFLDSASVTATPDPTSASASASASALTLPSAPAPSCATALLMGCSSAALDTHGPSATFGPSGMLLSYLNAGAPAVVGALWDVTDRDCDRFAIRCGGVWGLWREDGPEGAGPGTGAGGSDSALSGRRVSLAEAVMRAREACYLKNLNGAAMVVYGVPVYLRERV